MALLGHRQERRKRRRAAQWAVPSLPAPSFSVPPSVGQQEGQTFKTEHKIHLLTQPMYLQGQGHVKPASLSHPLPAHRWAELKQVCGSKGARQEEGCLRASGEGPRAWLPWMMKNFPVNYGGGWLWSNRASQGQAPESRTPALRAL